MNNTCLLVHCILGFEGTSYKRIQDAASPPVPFFLFYIASEFTSADIIFTTFYNLVQHLLKKGFRHKFSFFNGFIQTPTLLTAKIR